MFGRGVLYLTGSVLQRASLLALLPLVVLALPPEEFSKYGLMISSFSLLVPLTTLNMHLASTRLAFDYHGAARREFVGGALVATVVASSVSLCLVGVTLAWADITDPVTSGEIPAMVLLALVVVATATSQFAAVLVRINGRAHAFAFMMLVQGLSLLGGFLLLTSIIPDGLFRLLVSHSLSSSLASCVGLAYTRDQFTLASPRPFLRQIVGFSSPTVVHMVALWGMTYGGRWIGGATIGLEEIATYTLLTQAVVAVGLLTRSLFDARVPEVGTAYAANDPRRARRALRQPLATAIGAIAVGYTTAWIVLYLNPDILPTGYELTAGLLLIAAATSVLEAFYVRGSRILEGLKKTGAMAASTVFSGTIALGISFALTLQGHGEYGLLVGVVTGFGLQAASTNSLAAILSSEVKAGTEPEVRG